MRDDRGPVVGTVETAQTFLTAVEVDALVGDYLAGTSVKDLAERFGIHRATVFSHLRRRNVPSRRPGLGLDEKVEVVRLARAGVSMRAIAQRMGVDRKAVSATPKWWCRGPVITRCQPEGACLRAIPWGNATPGVPAMAPQWPRFQQTVGHGQTRRPVNAAPRRTVVPEDPAREVLSPDWGGRPAPFGRRRPTPVIFLGRIASGACLRA